MNLIITFPKEIRELAIRETELLGGVILDATPSSLLCEVDEITFYTMHLQHALADQIHLRLRAIPARNPEMVFDQVRRIKWFEYLDSKKPYCLKFTDFHFSEGDDHGEQDHESRWQQTLFKKINQGIWDNFKYRQSFIPKAQRAADQVVVVHQEDGGKRLSLSLNTSGRSLHKRGYKGKDQEHPAPLKENLARALIHWMDYRGDEILWDPFCGSGTIVIEAIYQSLNKATQIHRAKGVFGFENYLFFNRGLWREIQEEARRKKLSHLDFPVFASDLEGKYIELAKGNALKARVERYAEWDARDFFEIKMKGPRSDIHQGVIISNLPYDERLPVEDMAHFYKRLGETIREYLDGWRIGFLVAEKSPWKEMGITPDAIHPVNNGGIPCQFLIFN